MYRYFLISLQASLSKLQFLFGCINNMTVVVLLEKQMFPPSLNAIRFIYSTLKIVENETDQCLRFQSSSSWTCSHVSFCLMLHVCWFSATRCTELKSHIYIYIYSTHSAPSCMSAVNAWSLLHYRTVLKTANEHRGKK